MELSFEEAPPAWPEPEVFPSEGTPGYDPAKMEAIRLVHAKNQLNNGQHLKKKKLGSYASSIQEQECWARVRALLRPSCTRAQALIISELVCRCGMCHDEVNVWEPQV